MKWIERVVVYATQIGVGVAFFLPDWDSPDPSGWPHNWIFSGLDGRADTFRPALYGRLWCRSFFAQQGTG